MIENYEDFSLEQKKVLEQFVTSLTSNVFVVKNLPEVIKGALFSRYSRSMLPLRSLLLRDFITDKDSLFQEIAAGSSSKERLAIQKAQDFYDRILDGYGDDSIGELGGAHLAMENISMLATKVIEDARIGGSPLEKSTRYIYFNNKHKGKYLYYRDPKIMDSEFASAYEDVCDMLFDTYAGLSKVLTEHFKKSYEQQKGVSDAAYRSALRAKVLDCLRGLLPASTLTNMGQFGNGRFYETLVQKLHLSSLSELKDLGKKSYRALSCVIPSFVRRSHPEHRHFLGAKEFTSNLQKALNTLAVPACQKETKQTVRLVYVSQDPVNRVLEALHFSGSHASFASIQQHVASLEEREKEKIFSDLAACRENRRHKLPRALEHAHFTFEITADYGIYRDLQRHRMLTQERQTLTCDHGYWVPQDLQAAGLHDLYCDALDKAKALFDCLKKRYPNEAQYVVPMAYNIRWYFHVNLRNLQWLCELRSTEQGHAMYRKVAQKMADQVMRTVPCFKSIFKFVDFKGYDLGRLKAEIKKENKVYH